MSKGRVGTRFSQAARKIAKDKQKRGKAGYVKAKRRPAKSFGKKGK